MDKSKIPTTSITVGKGESKREITVYQWMTASEEQEHVKKMLGQALEVSLEQGNTAELQTVITNSDNLADANKFLIGALCLEFTYEDFEVMEPEMRAELVELLNEVKNKKK